VIIKESNRKDVEARLSTMGDYVKIDYLSELLKNNLDYDTRRFVLLKLASIYKNKGMLAEAGRLVRNAADINTTYEGMMNDYTKAMQLFIQSGDFDEADISLNKAVASCNTEGQRAAIKIKRKETIQLQAQEYIKRDKRKHAMLAFEKLLSIRETNSDEKRQAQTQLLRLYEQLGKVKEFYNLQKSM